MSSSPEPSAGHLLWQSTPYGLREYFTRGNEVLVAPVDNVVMPDGYRCGRFECYLSRWDDYRATFKIEEAV